MRSHRIAISLVLFAMLFSCLSAGSRAARQPELNLQPELFYPELVAAYHGVEPAPEPRLADDHKSGIKEDVPEKYASRYLQWKQEFLATEAGRNQWESYQNNPNFTLRIVVSRENAEGATTGGYEWNSAGQLIAATITLGVRLDAGYPNPIYFPVMNSLVPTETSYKIDGSTLAATKLAHEFGHVNRTAKVNPTLYQLQSQVIPQYNKIFLSNGRNANDPRLLELARQIGGTPVEVWEDREYWGEANAMAYLRDRFTEESQRCPLFARIRRTVDLYAKNYEPRFLEIAQATPARKICGW
jgi:YD repeat-containing protein